MADRTIETKGPLHLTLRIGLISIGLATFAFAATLNGMPVVVPVILGGAVIASAFSGLPAAIVSYVRSRRGPRYEAFFAILSPLAVALITAWTALRDVSYLSFGTVLGPPRWVDIALPVIYAAIALMNLGVIVANVLSLRQRR